MNTQTPPIIPSAATGTKGPWWLALLALHHVADRPTACTAATALSRVRPPHSPQNGRSVGRIGHAAASLRVISVPVVGNAGSCCCGATPRTQEHCSTTHLIRSLQRQCSVSAKDHRRRMREIPDDASAPGLLWKADFTQFVVCAFVRTIWLVDNSYGSVRSDLCLQFLESRSISGIDVF